MKRILSIETATTVCSVAIHEDGHCIALKEICEPNAHSEKLTVLIEELLASLKFQVSDCNAIALSQGPGSYTGLRIGASVAKGLCYACNLPLITVDTLQAIALSCKKTLASMNGNEIFMPMIDARRMEVYTAQWDSSMNEIQKTYALIVSEETKQIFKPEKHYYLCGDGSAKCKELLSIPNVTFVDAITATATTIGDIATDLYDHNAFANVAYFEPFYLKEFQATTPKKLL